MEYYQQKPEEIAKQLNSSLKNGLTTKQATKNAQIYGLNKLTENKKDTWYKVLIRQFKGSLIYILVAAAITSGFLKEYVDMIAILVILLINGILGFIQEWKAQNSIESLRNMARSKATVIRDGRVTKIDSELLVPGDIIILQTGDKIPADARIIEENLLETQEGALTGESTTISKDAEVISKKVTLAEQKNMVFAGTTVTKGRAKAIVVATGMKTQIGKIANLINQSTIEETPLQKNLGALGKKIGQVTLVICAIIFFVIAFSNELTIHSIQKALLLSISLAVAAVPEGLPIVVTIALAFGTQRMIKKNALIKRLASVETLGSTTVICTDKTGTLTKNEMTVKKIWFSNKTIDVTGSGYSPKGEIKGEVNEIIYKIAALCNDSELIEKNNLFSVTGDPTEGCLLTLVRKAGFDETKIRKENPRVAEIPFDSNRKSMSTINKTNNQTYMYTKGAVDLILNKCSKIQLKDKITKLTEEEKEEILKVNKEYAKQALRVLALAYKPINKIKVDETDETDLIFVGLVAMIDPPREEVKQAIQKCKEAGIRVIMITGDHKITAEAIAKELGIQGKAIEGKDIEKINLAEEVDNIGVFARVNPEDKMMIIDALKQNGEIVAMTGDGVNDAPALKKADIGIAMGITGTDVAKDSASMILTDDNFASIVHAVEEGRNIYTNIKKFVNYLLSSNFAEILVIFFSVLLFTHQGHPAEALTVAMLLYINLLTDSLPALALGVDPGQKDVMKRKPRDPKEPIITKNMALNILLIGMLVTGAVLTVFYWSLKTTNDISHARSMALTTIVALEIVRLAMIRKQYNTPALSNPYLILSLTVVFILQIIVLYTPFMRKIFETYPLNLTDWGVVVAVSSVTFIIGLLIGEVIKKLTKQED